MLFHSTPCQQPWRTSTFLSDQCHRPSSDFLESQKSTKTRSSSSTLVVGPQLDSWSPQTSHHPRPRHQPIQHYLTDSLNRYCIYKVSIGHRQFMQSQRSSYKMGGWWSSQMCMCGLTTTCTPSSSSWSTPGPWWRQSTLRRCTFYIHRYRLTSEQNLPTIQRNLHIPSFVLAIMDYQELTPFITKDTSRCTLATIHSLPLYGPPQPHHPQGHRTLQTTLSGCHLSQWRQTSHIPTNLLSDGLFSMPHQDLRRSLGIPQIGGQPKWHHRKDHRRNHQEIWQDIPLGPRRWPWPTKRLRPAKTQKTVSGRTTNRELLYGTFSTYVELHRQDDLQPITSSVPPQPGKRRCVRPHQAPQEHRFWHPSYATHTQSRPCWLLHEHRHGPVHR